MEFTTKQRSITCSSGRTITATGASDWHHFDGTICRTPMVPRVTQLLPSPEGTRAVYGLSNGTVTTIEMIAWGLGTHCDGDTTMVAMVLSDGYAEQAALTSNFVGVAMPGEDAEERFGYMARASVATNPKAYA